MAPAMVSERRVYEQADENRRAHHYAKSEGVGRRITRRQREKKVDAELMAGAKAEPSTLAQVTQALEMRQTADRLLATRLNDLPRGKGRAAAVQAALRAGYSQADLAVMMRVSRARMSQLAKTDSIPF